MRSTALALPLLLLLPVGVAHAQAPGSYQQSCTDISQNGSTLTARCRRPNGDYSNTSIDLGRCRGQGVANSSGRLSCGGVVGSAGPSEDGGPRRRRFNQGGDDQAYGMPRGFRPPGPRYDDQQPRYAAPRQRYYGQPDDEQDAGYAPPPRRQPRYDPDQDY